VSRLSRRMGVSLMLSPLPTPPSATTPPEHLGVNTAQEAQHRAEVLTLLQQAHALFASAAANCAADARDAFQRVLDLSPTCAEAYWGRALCYSALLDPERAMADLDRACGADPLDSRFILARARTHRAQGNTHRALEDIQRAEALLPSSPEPLFERAQLCCDLGEDFDAVDALTRAFERDHRFVKALSERARIYMNHECFVAALADYATCTQLQPEDPQHWVNLGNAFYELGDFGRATPNYQHALSLRANLPEVYLNLGCVALDQDNLHAALRHFDRAIHLDATYARAYLNRGLTHLYLGRTQKADADVTKAIELDDQDPDSRFAFARVCAHVNRLRPAIDALAFALDRCPDYVDELVEDPIFADLRKLNDVKKLIARAEQALADLS
jgi:tetratricopeptide (TPR) repeat protein